MGPKKNPNDPKWVPLGPQGDSHPKTAAIPSHDKNRLKCCLVCWRYCNEFVLNDTLKTGIHSLFAVVFDYSDRKTPLGICSTCRRGIYDFNKTGVNSKNLVLVHKTVDFIIIPAATRSEQVCTHNSKYFRYLKFAVKCQLIFDLHLAMFGLYFNVSKQISVLIEYAHTCCCC